MEIQKLNLDSDQLQGDDESGVPAPPYWSLQFQQIPTFKQKKFDWTYGVLLPLVCVAADPIVFVEQGLLGSYRPFAHTLSAVSILTMAAWLLWGEKLGWLAAPVAGLFVAGSFVSLAVGVYLFPYSFFGLIFVIGIFGFTPLFSAFVYLRNGVRAFRSAKLSIDPPTAVRVALLAALFSLVIPYVINAQF